MIKKMVKIVNGKKMVKKNGKKMNFQGVRIF